MAAASLLRKTPLFADLPKRPEEALGKSCKNGVLKKANSGQPDLASKNNSLLLTL
ncbi:hypothetical protein [Flavobacterium sp.]|uniref:hypothetical protein n=1 Tax=Flavobacterium sp. TaxID=239 RepID=UPI0025BE8E4B|nr:hypothetical protein [Flavobacterium sp.]